MHRRDAGEFLLDGEAVDFGSTAESKAAGVAVIYQEPTLFPDLSVTENIFMGRQPLGRGRRIDRAAMYAEAERARSRGSACTSTRAARRSASPSPTSRSSRSPRRSRSTRSVLIMDEPTAALSGVEVERLFAVARSLRDEGRALVFISHRFDEVFALCDTVTVMRDGDYVATDADRRHRPSTRSSSLMVGREVGDLFPKTPADDRRRRCSRSPGCTVRRRLPRRLASRSAPARSSAWPAWSAPAAARSPAPSSASTATTPARCTLRGKPPCRRHARAPRSGPGMAFIPEDRRKQGLVTEASVARNVAGVIRRRLARPGS